MKIEKELIDTWKIGKVLLACHGTDFGDLDVVGKENNKLQLARRIYSEGERERLIVVEEYLPLNIILSQTGGCIEQIKSETVITTITEDEYYGRKKTSQEKQKYIEILRGCLFN